jgi:hypothetical protein
MAYLQGFEYDIFISYAHVDNIALFGQKEGWVEHFCKNLNIVLAQRFGRLNSVKVWWDERKLDGATFFDKSIEESIRKSAIMICLTSPGYLASDYCRKELELFHKKASQEAVGLQVGNRSRILQVLLNNIPKTKWPNELGGVVGFGFHDANDSEDYGDAVDPGSVEYKNQLQNLRDALWNLLADNAWEGSKILPPLTVEQVTPACTVFVGEVVDRLRITRKRMINELERKGFRVKTGIPPPFEVSAHDETVKNMLQDVDFGIHLLDEYPGREIDEIPDQSYPQRQAELVLQSGKSQVIWVPSETNVASIEDESYKQFMNNLETGAFTGNTYEYIRGSKSSLAQQIMDFSEGLKIKQQKFKAQSGPLSVLLDTHFNDQLYALDLGKALLENQIQPFINPQEDDPRKNINLLGERISQVRKLIFLYGHVSREWVLERMSAALQLIITRNYPIDDFFIYMAPPHKSVDDISINQKFLKVSVVDCSRHKAIDPSILQPFLQELKSSVG